MKKCILTILFSVGLIIGTAAAYAEQDRAPNLDFDGEIKVGAVLNEEFLKQSIPGADQHARDILSSFEGSVLVRINGKLVRVMKGNRTVIEILDDPGTFTGESWGHDEESHRDAWKNAEEREREEWKRHQEKQREQAKKDAEREREARKRAAEKAREVRKKQEKRKREFGKSLEEQGKETEAERQVRL